VAGNQQAGYDELVRLGAILPLGREPVRDVGVLAGRLADAVAVPGSLREVARRAADVTDGEGARRVAAALLEGGLP
jgi:hypothetical protein